MNILFGVIIHENFSLLKCLLKVGGLNQFMARNLCYRLGYDPSLTFYDLCKGNSRSLRIFLLKFLDLSYKYGGFKEVSVFKEEFMSVKMLKAITHYRGFRHWGCWPVHGQRTRSNAGTQFRIGKRFNVEDGKIVRKLKK